MTTITRLPSIHPNLYMGSLEAARKSRTSPLTDQDGDSVSIRFRVSVCQQRAAFFDSQVVLRDTRRVQCQYDKAVPMARRLWYLLRMGKVLVHCHQGRNRCAFLCLIYANLYAHQDRQRLIHAVRSSNAHRMSPDLIFNNPRIGECLKTNWNSSAYESIR